MSHSPCVMGSDDQPFIISPLSNGLGCLKKIVAVGALEQVRVLGIVCTPARGGKFIFFLLRCEVLLEVLGSCCFVQKVRLLPPFEVITDDCVWTFFRAGLLQEFNESHSPRIALSTKHPSELSWLAPLKVLVVKMKISSLRGPKAAYVAFLRRGAA